MTTQIAELKTAVSSAATAISDFTAATQKRAANDKESDLTEDREWGCDRCSNRDNPALGCQDLAGEKLKP